MEHAFFRFPHTPHLAWLGEGHPRDDKVLSLVQANEFLSDAVVVEEKLDGANLGFSVDSDGRLQAQNRGQYLIEPFSGQFARLRAWLDLRADALASAVSRHDVILFGEWCAARHSLAYDRLPDWFMVFDVYERASGRFWNSDRRDAFAQDLDLGHVPKLAYGHLSLADLQLVLVQRSSLFRDGMLEGVVIRRESAQWCEARAKLVRPDFVQTIGEHWRRRALEWNRIGPPAVKASLQQRI